MWPSTPPADIADFGKDEQDDNIQKRKQQLMTMPEPGSPQQNMGQLDALLLCSLRRYEDILTLFGIINNDSGGTSPATLDSRGAEILRLQEQAALADYDLVALLQQEDLLAANYHLLSKRREIMDQILQYNHSLLTTVSNVKSLLAHEIKEAQSGRAALNGYRQPNPAQNGGILKGSL